MCTKQLTNTYRKQVEIKMLINRHDETSGIENVTWSQDQIHFQCFHQDLTSPKGDINSASWTPT